ncbi:MAG: DUF1679 domain-containing protein [Planctomycetaceae bacterium]|nr:DUF1679 domain-containing protein [Planctomycetaceae bacterium]
MTTLSETVCQITGADSVELGKEIQSLWSGYGVIQCAELQTSDDQGHRRTVPVVVKHIDISSARTNPRGWGSETSHQRKVRSYQVEKTFYECFSRQCNQLCLVPDFIAAHEKPDEGGWVIVLADLNALGFDRRKSEVDQRDIQACLAWLANFHATFMGEKATGLWPVGTYWHLETRPDELAAMPAGPLRQSAEQIDHRLSGATFQTLVHGDAKVANFCFSDDDRDRVSAVDFQYVGRGCGMKDVAYFISSCLSEQAASRQQDALLNFYFQQLQIAVTARAPGVNFSDLEGEWRELYPFAWADFCRFLSGWSPGHWKLNAYSDQITQSVLDQLRRK